MAWHATILGGPRDGEIVEVTGRCFYESVLRTCQYVPVGEESAPPLMSVRVYELRQTLDGDFRYVRTAV